MAGDTDSGIGTGTGTGSVSRIQFLPNTQKYKTQKSHVYIFNNQQNTIV